MWRIPKELTHHKVPPKDEDLMEAAAQSPLSLIFHFLYFLAFPKSAEYWQEGAWLGSSPSSV